MGSVIHACEVIKTLDTGGAEVLLVERLLAAPRAGTCYTVVCLRASGQDLADRLRGAGIEVVDLTACPARLRLPRLPGVVRRLRPDVVNVHSPVPAAVLRPASLLWTPRPRLVSTVHSVRFRLPTILADRATGWMDAHTVAVSPQVARGVTTKGARRLSVRVHGVDVEGQRRAAAEADRVRQEWQVPEGAFLVVHVGNFRPVKNHRLLVEAAAKVVAREPRATFLLAGSGPLYEETARRVAELGTGGVRLLGPVPGAGRLIAAADLLVISSTYEGLPVVAMEALAAGVPVVSTRVGGVPDVVEPGVNGLLTRPDDVEALAAGILEAMRPDVHARLREGARAAAGRFDIRGTARWFEDLYAGLCR
ncbi:glycosyltransferase [Nonomuraea pusilla]|uniref:Glycosyltransferase involved in cell wall bisynthesis n=1 Tax=Nonomuraea pusilla TaxID=46177 RepID=A0A1H7FH78_9ACTN|nr:glycosyltransferase [Nonomuraea pusilla]SEK22645.1 Glycosyltransferase involved in cell wall bisynthesis [Nonomuraea pusilla]